jgi:endoglucanase
MQDLIKKLAEAWGPSGFEHHVRELIRAEVQDLADDIRVDALGNLICRMGTVKKGGLRVMLAAHMDEIGVLVSHVDRQGYLRFSNLGASHGTTLLGNRVKFENGVIGTIGVEERWSQRTRVPNLDKYFIDVSTGNDTSSVGIGDAAIFWRTLDERGDRLIAKSLDDRVGCAILIETMRKMKKNKSPHEMIFVFTAQEEVGRRGAMTAGYGVFPDFALAVDVVPAGDEPKGVELAVELGQGMVIKVMDTHHVVPPAIKNLLVETAQHERIPYQLEILTLGSTDASVIQLAQSGVPSGAVGVPCRYVHTPSETVDIKDVRACVDLLVAVLSKPAAGIKPE